MVPTRDETAVLLVACLGVLLWGCGEVRSVSREKTGAPADQAGREPGSGRAGYTGSKACRDCHEHFYEAWASSHHGLAMQPCTAKFARAELEPQDEDIEIGGFRYRAVIDGDKGHVREVGPDGEKTYEMVHALGGKNVYYFLTPLPRGRLQVLPVAFDVRKKTWYDTTASAARHFEGMTAEDEVYHWRERPLTFNTACYGCHVSQVSTNYDIDTDTYRTVWAEAGINCETCHGPAGDHVRVCEAAGEGVVPEDLKIIRHGRHFTPEQRTASCAPCHARMSPITAAFRPGEGFFDHYDLTTLETRDHYPDGRDLGENYTFTLWRMNPCARSGDLDCLHCHTSSGRFRQSKDPNRSCLPCHEGRVQDPTPHTHHNEGGPGCIDCHMPMTEFARMRRSDHSALPPTPAATLAFGSPNACNLCHDDRDAAWADRWVRQRQGRDYQAPVLHRAGLIKAARNRDWKRSGEMLAYLQRKDRDEVFAASLIHLLRACPDGRLPAVLVRMLADPSPLVRARAAEALAGRQGEGIAAGLLKAVGDDVRLVRIRAAAALGSLSAQSLEAGPRERLARAMAELKASLEARPDDFASHHNLGNFYSARGDPARALASYERAMKLRPDHAPSLVNASLVHNHLGANKRAEACLRRALDIDPDNAAAHLNLGMLLGEVHRLPEAEACFRAALRTDPMSAPAAYNLGILAGRDRNRLDEAVDLCARAHKLCPHEDRYGYSLAYYLNQRGDREAAVSVLEKAVASHSSHAGVYRLLGEILENQGKGDRALEIYRRAAENPGLDPRERHRFERKIRTR